METMNRIYAADVLYPKADVLKRFIALVIDLIVVFLLMIIPRIGWLAGTVYLVFRDGFNWRFMQFRSLGKKLMKLDVVITDNIPPAPSLLISLKRNWMFIVPVIGFVAFIVEGICVFQNKEGLRFGDKMAHTRVVAE